MHVFEEQIRARQKELCVPEARLTVLVVSVVQQRGHVFFVVQQMAHEFVVAQPMVLFSSPAQQKELFDEEARNPRCAAELGLTQCVWRPPSFEEVLQIKPFDKVRQREPLALQNWLLVHETRLACEL